MKKADLMSGYKHLWSDLPVLPKYADFDLKKLPCYDIMVEIEKKIGYKLKLDDVCKANLGSKKTDDFSVYKNYYWDKNWFPLIDYCMHDVKLTEQIFRQIMDTQTLKYNDLQETKEVIVDKPSPSKIAISEDMESFF